MGAPRQPDDAWSFLRGGNDDEATGPLPAEEDAVHLLEPSTPFNDPARNDLAALVDGDSMALTASWFGDEEPDREDGTSEDDHEPDLEEILESQHYAFDQRVELDGSD